MTDLVLTFAAALSGDFNGDGTVDAADYVVWRKTDGSQAGYNAWRTNFGATAGTGSSNGAGAGAVPEPGTWMLIGSGLAMVAAIRRRSAAAR
jgi:hypothetical protein